MKHTVKLLLSCTVSSPDSPDSPVDITEVKLLPSEEKPPPFVPKFKVGDRVKIKGSNDVEEVMHIPRDKVYQTKIGPATVTFRHEDALEPYVWTLSDLPGFRPLEEGEQWHREDGWTEEILSDGYRPLLRGEAIQEGDELLCEERWVPQQVHGRPVEFSDWMDRARIRTRRPLPDTERERFENTFPNLIKHKTPSGIYSHQPTQYVWEGWQAARKAQ